MTTTEIDFSFHYRGIIEEEEGGGGVIFTGIEYALKCGSLPPLCSVCKSESTAKFDTWQLDLTVMEAVRDLRVLLSHLKGLSDKSLRKYDKRN